MQFRTQYSASDCMMKLNELKNEASADQYSKADVQIEGVEDDSFVLECVGEYFGRRISMLRYKGQVSDNPDAGGAVITGAMQLAAGFKSLLCAMAVVFMLPSIIIMLVGYSSDLGRLLVKNHVGFIVMLATIVLLGPPLVKLARNTRERINSFFQTELAAEEVD